MRGFKYGRDLYVNEVTLVGDGSSISLLGFAAFVIFFK